ncbi:MAG: NADP-dependent oxidoreductase [Gemmatimonadota bacterium]|nr:NADP-dependent oxidoreductase [Gemmatimonadota bacterium]
MQSAPSSPNVNRRVVLAARPRGEPVPSDFRLEEMPIPEIRQNQVLLQTMYLSLDPYMRGLMNETTAENYAPPLPLGAVMPGGTVSRVASSSHPDFGEGDLVASNSGWQEYQAAGTRGLERLERDMAHPSYAVGVLGMTGFTAYHGLLRMTDPQPGETVALAAATGAVGAVVGQLAKMRGCRVVGLAGSQAKIDYAEGTLGYDVCINRRDADMALQVAAACPDGIDVYFENVGGPIFDAVLPHMNLRSRIPICGLIAHYNEGGLPSGPNRLPLFQMAVLTSRIMVKGFIISDHYFESGVDNRPVFRSELTRFIDEGHIDVKEDITDGLENAPETFIGMLNGENFGKTLIRVAD